MKQVKKNNVNAAILADLDTQTVTIQGRETGHRIPLSAGLARALAEQLVRFADLAEGKIEPADDVRVMPQIEKTAWMTTRPKCEMIN